MELYLKLDTVHSLVSTEHDILVSCEACHWAGCAIDESPALLKRGTFVMDDFGKKGRIQKRVQGLVKTVINVINNLQKGLFL